MFNTNSDYVINKLDTDAIVCRSVTGQLLRITREDFSSDEEFEKWKLWSDTDYHETELRNRAYSDRKTESSIARYIEAQDADWLTMELKAAEHVRAKSLMAFMKRYGCPYAIRVSGKNFGFENGIRSVPLYGVFCLEN